MSEGAYGGLFTPGIGVGSKLAGAGGAGGI